MQDTGRNISYLKVDIEGAEIAAIPEWIQSGILDSVRQGSMLQNFFVLKCLKCGYEMVLRNEYYKFKFLQRKQLPFFKLCEAAERLF